MGNNSININDEVDTKHPSIIPESTSDKIYNSIVRIEIDQFIGTGFL